MKKSTCRRLVIVSTVGVLVGYPGSYWALKHDSFRDRLPDKFLSAFYRSKSAAGATAPSAYERLYKPMIVADFHWHLREAQRKLEGVWYAEDSGDDVLVRVRRLTFDECEASIHVGERELWSGKMTPELKRWTLETVDESPPKTLHYNTPKGSSLTVDWSGKATVHLTWKPRLRTFASMDGWTAHDPFFVAGLELGRQK